MLATSFVTWKQIKTVELPFLGLNKSFCDVCEKSAYLRIWVSAKFELFFKVNLYLTLEDAQRDVLHPTLLATLSTLTFLTLKLVIPNLAVFRILFRTWKIKFTYWLFPCAFGDTKHSAWHLVATFKNKESHLLHEM